jgi:hypothetical protein
VRNPVATGADDAVERLAGGGELDRVLAAMMMSTSASTAGSAMPARFCDPLVAAAWEEKYVRSESPGVAEKLNRSTVMSKSKLSTRARYCTGSTTRKVASMPSVARFLM